MVSPSEIKRASFTLTKKGYTPSEVEEYISYLLSKYTESHREYTELEKKYKIALQRLDEATNADAAFSAIVLDAKKMADAIVKDANEKAKAVTDAVNESCEKILSAYKENVIAERNKLAKTEKLAMEFKESLYSAYRTHIEAIDLILPDEKENNEPDISSATDEELMDSAVELARQMYENNGEIELPDLKNDKEAQI